MPPRNLDPDPHAALAESWCENARAWAAAVRDGAIESRRLATDEAILRAALERRPRRILDLGCGEGWLARALAGYGVDAIGTDASAPLIEAARAAGGGTFICASYDEIAADPGLCGGPFDVAVANFALLDDRIAPLLAALRQALAADGRLLVQTLHPATAGPPYEDGWRTEDFRGFAETGWTPMPWYFRTLGSWLAALRQTGFTLTGLVEPVHPETGMPLSLLMEAAPQ